MRGSSAGGSARREAERRRAAREAAVRKRSPRLGGFILRVTEEPQSTKAWGVGAAGEAALGAQLDSIGDRVEVLHDRRIPGRRSNIDDIVIASNGIWVIDCKNYTGKVERRDKGGWRRTDFRLYVKGRDRTVQVEGMAKQVAAVGAALDELEDVPINPVLCFLNADWTLFARPFEIDGVLVTWRRALFKRILADGTIGPRRRARLSQQLAGRLPPA